MKKTDEALSRLIEKGIEVAEKTGNFAIEQAPELLKEFYTWHIYQNVFGCILGVLCLFASYKIIKVFGSDNDDWDTDLKIFNKHIGAGCIITGGVSFIFGVVFLLMSAYHIVFILSAPKLYLIEYFIK